MFMNALCGEIYGKSLVDYFCMDMLTLLTLWRQRQFIEYTTWRRRINWSINDVVHALIVIVCLALALELLWWNFTCITLTHLLPLYVPFYHAPADASARDTIPD